MNVARTIAPMTLLGSVLAGGIVHGQLVVTEEAKLVAADATDVVSFGASVSVSGDTMIVGADRDGEIAPNAGAAYVYVQQGTRWSEQAKLTAFDAATNDDFGCSTALEGETAVVGASRVGLPGDDDGGSAYVFVRDGTAWNLQQKLTVPDAQPGDGFGHRVALSGDTLVVSAPNDDFGDKFDAGSVYVFVREGSTWSVQWKLKALDAQNGDELGWSLAIDNDTVVAGALFDNHEGGNLAGSAYVFVRDGTSWSQQAKLLPVGPAQNIRFGISAAVSGDTAIVGAKDDNYSGISFAGSAYVFVRSGTTWTVEAKLAAPDAAAGDQFGNGVSLSGDLAVVTAPYDDPSGSAYAFVRSGTHWGHQAKFVATDPEENIGERPPGLALSEDLVVVGEVAAHHPGEVFVFRLPELPWTDLGSGLAGTHGVPVLGITGPLVAGCGFTVVLNLAAPTAPAMLFVSLSSTPTPFKCGTLVPVPVTFQLPVVTDGDGETVLGLSSWPPGLSGLDLYCQYGVQDAAAICGVALSNAVRADVP